MKNFLAIAAATMLLGACSSMPQMPKMPSFSMPSFGGAKHADAAVAPGASAEAAAPAAVAASEAVGCDQLACAIDLLDAGRAPEAKTALQAVLSKSPKDKSAPHLLEQIDADPVKLLGEKSESYTVATGDTMSGLAQRYLDDPLLFYALARYNGLAAPNALSVGRTLKIPSRPGKVVAAAKPLNASAASSANTGKANAVRLQALELLNAGDVGRAVSLLTEAHSLDEANVAIAKDLERARRIQSALVEG